MKKLLTCCLLIASLFFAQIGSSHGGDEGPVESSSQTLGKVKLTEEQQKILGIKTQIISLSSVKPSIEVSGVIEEIPDKRFQVNAPLPGRVSSINVQLGSNVTKGQLLAVLNSQEATQLASTGLTDQANYRSQVVQAQANLSLERKRYEREKALYEHRINSKKELEAAEASLKDTQAALRAAQQNLGIATTATNTRLSQIGASRSGQIYLRAPQTGQISALNLTNGQTVDSGQILIEGVNLRTVQASGAVFQHDISKVKLEQEVKIYPSESLKQFTGKISFISPVIDATQRSFAVKAIIQNPHQELRIGQFVQIEIVTQGETEQAILLPRDSTVEKNGEPYVYIRSGQYLAPVKIKIGKHKHQDLLEIEGGLAAGDEVVIEGAYLLPAKGEAAEDEHHHEENKTNNKIPLWLWFAGGGLLLVGAFLAGRATTRRRKEIL